MRKIDEAYQFIKEYITEKDFPPTIREIGEALGVSSTSTVSYYLRKLEEWKCFAKRRIGQILIFSSLVIMCLAAYIFDLPIYAGTYTPYSMFDARTLPTVALAIGMVLVMIDLPFRSTRWVNSISSCVFGVYLIHEHPLMREWIWETVFPLKEYVFSDLLFVVCIGKAIGVYVVCMLVDMARKGAIKGLCCGLQHGRYIHCR